ncbi:MAG TPA: asparagine synthetase B, partial [Flavobacteriales bacterium]|nr:asparagine synthetase B [Flavobacteriales bacterium]
FISADGKTVIVFNGEIYNYRELKTQLGDFNFRTNSDTEVLLAAWFKWGKECVHRLDGMFAFAIWDNDKQELFIARDRMGVKPLYYSQSGNSFLFSSELRGLLASGLVDRALDEEALTDYLK